MVFPAFDVVSAHERSGRDEVYSEPNSQADVVRKAILYSLAIVALSCASTWLGLAIWFGVDGSRMISTRQTFECGFFLSIIGALMMGPFLTFRGFQARYRLVVAREELRRISENDPLTGLLNRRGLDFQIKDALIKRGAGDLPAAALMLDLDHFKQVNDAHGHAFGDAALRRFAEVLREAAERAPGAIVARFGGEEFIVVLLGAGLDEAGRFADRVRGAFSSRPVEWHDDNAYITISVGLAATRDVSCEVTELIAKADAALYEAKRSGRNRVCSSPSLALAS